MALLARKKTYQLLSATLIKSAKAAADFALWRF